MYQSQVYGAQPGCCGCFGGYNAQVVPQGYGYDPYNQYNQYNQYGQAYDPYSQAALTTSIVAPVNLTPVPTMNPMTPMVNPMVGQVNDLYQSRTIQAPPIINKAVVNPPASKYPYYTATSRIEYVPYEVK